MRLPSIVRSLSRRQAIGIGAVGLLLASTMAFVVLRSDDDADVFLDTTSDDSTTTTDESTTTSTVEELTSTTAAPTTTEAVTTTEPPTTAPPATAPPTTAPSTSGSLNMGAVLTFAKANADQGTPPQTYTGANTCPAYLDRPRDAGDNAVRDIDLWYLARYCDGVYRAMLGTNDDSPLDSFWLQMDTSGGGCGGIDRVVIGWMVILPSGGSTGQGVVVATPGCDPATWQWVDAAGYPLYSGGALQLDFRGSAIGNPAGFYWRGAVKGAGESGAAIDVVPNGGPEHFVV